MGGVKTTPRFGTCADAKRCCVQQAARVWRAKLVQPHLGGGLSSRVVNGPKVEGVLLTADRPSKRCELALSNERERAELARSEVHLAAVSEVIGVLDLVVVLDPLLDEGTPVAPHRNRQPRQCSLKVRYGVPLPKQGDAALHVLTTRPMHLDLYSPLPELLECRCVGIDDDQEGALTTTSGHRDSRSAYLNVENRRIRNRSIAGACSRHTQSVPPHAEPGKLDKDRLSFLPRLNYESLSTQVYRVGRNGMISAQADARVFRRQPLSIAVSIPPSRHEASRPDLYGPRLRNT